MRPSPWLPGAGLFLLALLLGAGAGLLLGARAWWIYVGLVPAAILAMGWLERLWARRHLPRPPRARGRLKVIPGGKSDFDLEKDDPSQRQRWLM